jgi:hypothetical protein
MAHTFSRREFYELVWSKPMTHLAKDLGVSDVALHKVCRKHAIPNPPAGWWAKKAAGKKVQQIMLPEKAGDDRAGVITIRPVAVAAWQALAAESAQKITARTEGDAAPVLSKPSAKVRATLAALRQAKPNFQGLIEIKEPGLIQCSVAKNSIPRLANILPQLEAMAKIQGFSLTDDDKPCRFTNGDQSVTFMVDETFRREKHEPTQKEKAALAAWERRRKANNWRYLDNDPYPRPPDWDYSPTGELSIELETIWSYHHSMPRRSFKDGKRQRVEDMAAKVAIGIVVIAEAKAARQRDEEERARAQEIRRREREREEHRKRIEDQRNAELMALIELQSRVGNLEHLVGAIDALGACPDEGRVHVFKHWLNHKLDDARAQLTLEGLETRFARQGLFGPDDHEPADEWLGDGL